MRVSQDKLGQALGLGVLAIAVLYTASAASMPIRDQRADATAIASWLVLLLTQAGLYWYGATVRARTGLVWYVVAQAALVFIIGISGAMMQVVVCLYIALIAEIITLTDGRWSSAAITVTAILLFAVNAVIAWDLYQGSTVALLLAIAGVVAHAIAALRRKPALAGTPEPSPPATNGKHELLTDRELEVLRALVSGAKSAEIAATLGITERTVKAHLASIYQKLGVESRTAAVAAALQRQLI